MLLACSVNIFFIPPVLHATNNHWCEGEICKNERSVGFASVISCSGFAIEFVCIAKCNCEDLVMPVLRL